MPAFTAALTGLTDLAFQVERIQIRRSATALQISVTSPEIEKADEFPAPQAGELATARDGAEVARAPVRSIRLDEGANNASVSLDALSTPTASAPKTVIASGVIYRNLAAGARRFRCALALEALPGDTVVIGAESIIAVSLVHTIEKSRAETEASE